MNHKADGQRSQCRSSPAVTALLATITSWQLYQLLPPRLALLLVKLLQVSVRVLNVSAHTLKAHDSKVLAVQEATGAPSCVGWAYK